jgi:RecA-family ATPase
MGDVDLRQLLGYIDPAALSYQEWLSVGMALQHEGLTAHEWDQWSRRDPARYVEGECYRKWEGFRGAHSPITGATIVQMAKGGGWQPGREYRELDWDDTIGGKEGMMVVDRHWLEEQEVREPENWQPGQQLIEYLSTLFELDEKVGYVTESWYSDKAGKYLPSKGCYDRTAGQLIEELQKCGGDIGSVLGDYKPDVGAWVRFNPLDGAGVKNDNVTAFRYALVESDDMPIEQQGAIMRELELPIACLVHSGVKSLHAIVRVDADTYDDYRKRVDFLYEVCAKNGLRIDTQNRNPSRLSRMPGVNRNGQKQFLVAANIGMGSFNEWKNWILEISDDLPDPEALTAVWDNMPELAPPLIDGVLRQGHKMLLAGPSKSGKSYALIELCCSIAEGKDWLAWRCAQGRVLYVNLELDRASCLHRFRDVYEALGWQPDNIANIDIWNLRGSAVPMDKLAPKLIRRCQKKGYIAIVIDPIYKVITGDENSAGQMAHFCNQFDKVCHELGAAVIYCHHHSKGTQGNKRSIDRASGSGVFARDPDALLDLLELHVDEKTRNALTGSLAGAERVSAARWTAWRIDGTLREFEKFPPANLWFDYPVHRLDENGILKEADSDGGLKALGRKGAEANKRKSETNRFNLERAIEECDPFDNQPTIDKLANHLGMDDKKDTVRARVRRHGGYIIDPQTKLIAKKLGCDNTDNTGDVVM